jgi:hypothetical protein
MSAGPRPRARMTDITRPDTSPTPVTSAYQAVLRTSATRTFMRPAR